MNNLKFSLGWILVVIGFCMPVAGQTHFTFQGYLSDGNAPANGNFNLKFTPFDDAEADATQLAPAQLIENVPITNGLFSTLLDFGSRPFTGAGTNVWLEIQVQTPDSPEFQVLEPRQEITRVPYSMHAQSASAIFVPPGTTLNLEAGNGGLRVETTSLSPVAGPNVIAGFKDNVVYDNVTGATISGGGAQGDSMINSIHSSFAVIGGGAGNLVQSENAVIGGGRGNIIRWGSSHALIAGGNANFVGTNSWGSAVGGGVSNQILTNTPSSVIAGGRQNRISGPIPGEEQVHTNYASSIGGGEGNLIADSAAYAVIPGGKRAQAVNYGQFAFASGSFSSEIGGEPGDAQTSLYVLRRTTTDNSSDELFLNGDEDTVPQRITLPSGASVSFEAMIAARTETGTSAGFKATGMIKNVEGATTLVGTPEIAVLGADAEATEWDVEIVADDSNDALVVKVRGQDATTIRWVGSIRTAEVTF